MMDVQVITGIISGVIAVVVCLINNMFMKAETDKKHEANIMLISYRLEQLEKKVDIHNNVVERVFQLEKRADVTDEQIRVANHRIQDLEESR